MSDFELFNRPSARTDKLDITGIKRVSINTAAMTEGASAQETILDWLHELETLADFVPVLLKLIDKMEHGYREGFDIDELFDDEIIADAKAATEEGAHERNDTT